MRFMGLLKADKNSEASVPPSADLMVTMGRFIEEISAAGVGDDDGVGLPAGARPHLPRDLDAERLDPADAERRVEARVEVAGLLERLQEDVEELGADREALDLRAVDITLRAQPGAKTGEQAEENAGGAGWRMSDDEVALLDEATDRFRGFGNAK